MEGQLRYGTYKIWDGFKEHADYSFDLIGCDKNIHDRDPFLVKIQFYRDSQAKNLLQGKIQKIQDKKGDFNKDKEIHEVISGLDAIVERVSHRDDYTILHLPPTEIDGLTEFTEFVALQTNENVILISCHAFKSSFEAILQTWQAFYRSFRTDQSQPYKLKFGSFVPPAGMEDDSEIVYSPPGPVGTYTITISYISDKEKSNKQTLIDSRWVEVLGMMTGFTTDVKKVDLSIGGKRATYMETEAIDKTDPRKQKITGMLFFLENLSPGIEIDINAADGKTFNFYRGEMDDFFNSIKFDDQAK